MIEMPMGNWLLLFPLHAFRNPLRGWLQFCGQSKFISLMVFTCPKGAVVVRDPMANMVHFVFVRPQGSLIAQNLVTNMVHRAA